MLLRRYECTNPGTTSDNTTSATTTTSATATTTRAQEGQVIVRTESLPLKHGGGDGDDDSDEELSEDTEAQLISGGKDVLSRMSLSRSKKDALYFSWCLAGLLEFSLEKLGAHVSVGRITEGEWEGFPECPSSEVLFVEEEEE